MSSQGAPPKREATDPVSPELRSWFERRGIVASVELRDARGEPLSAPLARELREYVESVQARRAVLEKLSILGEVSASMAHEVRNVVSGILGLSQLEKPASSEDRVQLIRAEAERCSRLLSNFLSFASARESPAALASARDIFDPVCLMLVAEARSRRCQLVTTVDAAMPTFCVRVHELRQVMLNLALNAVQAAPEGGRVELSATADPSGVCLGVSDDGKGIATELLERIFEPFVTTKAKSGGTGLGLSTSRQLVEAMGGSVRAFNRAEGGATFEVHLPLVYTSLPVTPL